MDRTQELKNRRGLLATMTVARPYTREEKDFIRAFADALNHATAVIAAEPELSVTAGSIAHRVQRAYSRFRPERRSAIQQRARARLSGPSEERQRYFGVYAGRGAEAWTRAEPGLDRELKRLLREAVRARLDFQRKEISESLAVGVAAEVQGHFPLSKTTLEIGYFSGDVQAAWTTQTIFSPISIELRWETNAPGAERGVWQLFKSGGGNQEVLLASGKAGDAPGSIFKIDLGDYLPPNPPDAPGVYRIRVTPGTKPKLGSGPGKTGKAPGKAVGPPSNDVVITYSANVPPGVEFQIFDIYQTATFELEMIHMIEDQTGGGAEEFHIAGFVQETFPASSAQQGGQHQFGPFYAELDPDGPHTKKLPHSSSFSLNKPDTPEWPRAYTVVISVLEEDDGGILNEWESSVWNIAQDALGGDVNQIIEEVLEEQFQEFIGDNIGQIIQAGGQIAQTIAALIGTATSAIAGMIVAAAAFVIADIISGMGDDYYGTEVFVFVLPTNITDFVKSLPGQPITGGYLLDTQSLGFQGSTSWPEATAWDGFVKVSFHFEFTDKAQS
jgi:hypothetical protein